MTKAEILAEYYGLDLIDKHGELIIKLAEQLKENNC